MKSEVHSIHHGNIETVVTDHFTNLGSLVGFSESRCYPNSRIITETYDVHHKQQSINDSFSDHRYNITDDTLTIAVLGDLHGHISLGLHLLNAWKIYTGRSIDAILQVGDFGVFPTIESLDKATKKFAQSDSEELGFLEYKTQSSHGDYFFGPKGIFRETDLFFVKGNHEDFSFLDQFEQTKIPQSIDHYGHLKYLPNGHQITISNENHSTTISGLGGLDPTHSKRVRPYHITQNDYSKLYQNHFDILLTHDDFLNERSPQGSSRLRNLILQKQPHFHFFGHIRTDSHHLQQGRTESYHLDDVTLANTGKISPYCAGIISITNEESLFTYISHHWLTEFSRRYRHTHKKSA